MTKKNEKINISVVGTGLMGLQHIKAILKSKKANLHSIVDISKDAANLSAKYKVPLLGRSVGPAGHTFNQLLTKFCFNWSSAGSLFQSFLGNV